MTHDEIKKSLLDKGLTFSAIAKASGRYYQGLTAVTKRKSVSKPSALIISTCLELSIKEVFPDVPQYWQPKATELRVEKARAVLEKAGLAA